MASFTLSHEADQDIISIYLYTLQHFGQLQADKYHDALEAQFNCLAEKPHLGVVIDMQLGGGFRALYQSHTIYYRQSAEGIVIRRILH